MAVDVSVCCRRINVSVGVIKQENYIPETNTEEVLEPEGCILCSRVERNGCGQSGSSMQ